MKRFLIVSLFILLPFSLCTGYDVVLLDGKVVSGKLISENETLIVIKDTSGILVNFNKKDIDLEKTAERNQKEAKPAQSRPKGRVYTKEDLEKAPELSMSTTEPESDEEEGEEENESENEGEKEGDDEGEEPEDMEDAFDEDVAPDQSEEELWRSEARRLGIEMKNLEANLQEAQQQCDEVTIPSDYTGTIEQFAEEKRRACYRVQHLKRRHR